ncbi:MAG TPA: Mth938-like domain-containing protein, partial [Gammaproteobacteria bacterium]|nr:Mth938-like domain-containing protein [Gammaproteobacteria bacterium]
MKLHSDQVGSSNRITGYGSGYVAVNEVRIGSSVVVTPTRLLEDWAPDDFSEISSACFGLLDELEIEVALLGTGATQQFPGDNLIARFASRGVGLEIMDTAAACRTYNILMAEGRTVA